jgi:zinc protease
VNGGRSGGVGGRVTGGRGTSGGSDATRGGSGTSGDPLAILDRRPAPGRPRGYRFPGFRRERLPNGLTVLSSHLPGRPLLAAQLLLEGGAASEPSARAGVTALAAEALSEGTQRRGAIEFIEAAERLGASLQASAGWDTVAVALEVPRRRLEPALALMAEMVLQPAFPETEVGRLREERMNDLLQARADPRRQADRVFNETIYHPQSPYSRPLGGTEETVPGLDCEVVRERYAGLLDPPSATLIVGGDLERLPVGEMVATCFGPWTARLEGVTTSPIDASPHPDGPRVVVVDRPRAPQTEVRVGHVGLPRRIPDYHAVVVMSAILGGLFNSRLQRLLREERGFTYSVGAGFDLRRAAGPFSVRMAVETGATVPAVLDALAELRRIREEPPSTDEMDAARQYLIGVFPLRFETPSQVVSAIGGLVVHDLPDDELDRYRAAIGAVTAEDVLAAASHVDPDQASVVLVGDAARFERELRAAGLGPLSVLEASTS